MAERVKLTKEEMIEAIREALAEQRYSDDALSTQDIVDAIPGVTKDQVRRIMPELIKSGRFVVAWVMRPDWAGTHRPVPAVKLKNGAS